MNWKTSSALALAALLLGSAQAQPLSAQTTPLSAQRWEFNDPAGTGLPAVANGVAQGSAWTANLAGVATDGSGALRLGYNSSSTAYSYAPLNINEAGVYITTVVFRGWDIKNGANSGSSRPIFNLGLRSAASTSSSLIADVQFTATTSGVSMVVRDSASDFPTTTLPSQLTAALTVTLRVDRSISPASYTLIYAIEGGASGSYTGTLSATSSSRLPSHVNLAVSGNLPNGGANAAPLVERLEIGYTEAQLVLLPPANGRPGKPASLVNYLSGNPVQSTRAPLGGPALLLMGGGAEVDAAFTQRAYPVINGGDIVVLRVTGGNGYQNYLYSELVQQLPEHLRLSLQPNSVETLIVDGIAKANSDYVAQAVGRANMVWIAGGDQSQYIQFWRGTALGRAVLEAYKRGAVIGGTSAGMVVSGEWMYDPGAQLAVTSAEAVANPYRPSMILSTTDLFGLPLGFNLIPEPHFANRDRMGRLLSFMARLRQDARTSLIHGIGLDEGASLFIGADRIGHFDSQTGNGRGYVLAEDRRRTTRVQVAPGLPLIYRDVLRYRLEPGQRFDFARGLSTASSSLISVNGSLPVNPY